MLCILLSTSTNETLSSSVPFCRFDIHEEDSLNNRFKPLADIRTEAVFSVDDDLLVPCQTLEFAFELWTSAPDQLVGFVPRMHWRKKVRSILVDIFSTCHTNESVDLEPSAAAFLKVRTEVHFCYRSVSVAFGPGSKE